MFSNYVSLSQLLLVELCNILLHFTALLLQNKESHNFIKDQFFPDTACCSLLKELNGQFPGGLTSATEGPKTIQTFIFWPWSQFVFLVQIIIALGDSESTSAS